MSFHTVLIIEFLITHITGVRVITNMNV